MCRKKQLTDQVTESNESIDKNDEMPQGGWWSSGSRDEKGEDWSCPKLRPCKPSQCNLNDKIQPGNLSAKISFRTVSQVSWIGIWGGSTKKRIFYGQADCKGEGRGGLAPSAFGKCENFDPEKNEFFAPNGQRSVWRRCSRAKNLFFVFNGPEEPR